MCYAAVAGWTLLGTVVPRLVAGAILTIATAVLASALCSSRSQLAGHPDFTYEQNELVERKERGSEGRALSEWREDSEYPGFGGMCQKFRKIGFSKIF